MTISHYLWPYYINYSSMNIYYIIYSHMGIHSIISSTWVPPWVPPIILPWVHNIPSPLSMFHPRNMRGRYIKRSTQNSTQLVPCTCIHPSKGNVDTWSNCFLVTINLILVQGSKLVFSMLVLPCFTWNLLVF